MLFSLVYPHRVYFVLDRTQDLAAVQGSQSKWPIDSTRRDNCRSRMQPKLCIAAFEASVVQNWRLLVWKAYMSKVTGDRDIDNFGRS